MRNDHFIPAAFLGGFGATSSSGKARRARIAVRFSDSPGVVQITTPEDIAKEPGIYRLQSPPMGLSPDVVDRAWRTYEPALPEAIHAIEQNCYGSHEIQIVAHHFAAQGVRHPDYILEAQRYLAAQGAPMSDVDLPQLQRIRTMTVALDMLAQAELAFLFPAPGGRRFVVNDKGFIKLGDLDSKRSGIFFPLSRCLTALVVLGAKDGNDERTRRLILKPGAVDMLNEISWRQRNSRFVVGHPDDVQWIARLDDAKKLQPPQAGPYLGTPGGFFDWVRF